MKKKKTFVQSCAMGTPAKRKVSTASKMKAKRAGVDKKNVEEVYNKFYKDQVAALYRAVKGF